MKLIKYQIDTSKFCGDVTVDENDIIVDGMPIIQVFFGQPIENLKKWASRRFRYCTLKRIK